MIEEEDRLSLSGGFRKVLIEATPVIHLLGRKGFGFVSFCNPEEAKKALKSLNGTVVDGRSLYVAVAQSKEERSKSLKMTQHQPQSLYTSNWDVLAPPFFPLPLLPTPIPTSHIKSSLPNMNQYLGNYEGASYTLGEHNYQGNYSTYPWNAANVTGVHLEMNKSDILKRLKSPNSLAIQVGNAANYYLSTCNNNHGYAKKHTLFIKWKYLKAKAASYYYNGLILDKGNEPSCHITSACCFLSAEELLAESKKACLSFCLAIWLGFFVH